MVLNIPIISSRFTRSMRDFHLPASYTHFLSYLYIYGLNIFHSIGKKDNTKQAVLLQKSSGTTSTRQPIPPLMKGYILCPPISNFTVCPCFNALAASLKKLLDTTIFRMSQRLFHKIDSPHPHPASKPNDIQVHW